MPFDNTRRPRGPCAAFVRPGVTAFVFGGLVAAAAGAQTPRPAPDRPTIGSTLPANVVRDLPTSANVFSVLETTQPEVVADRFNSGGLNAGEPGRTGGFLASWSETRYRIGDVNIASPNGGAPLLFPELVFWEHVHIATGLMPVDNNASGLAVSLEPRRPSAQWTGIVEGSASGGGLASQPGSTGPPAIARLREWAHGSILLSGPVIERRLGLVIGGTWTRNAKFERAGPIRLRGEVASVFAHAILTMTPGTEVRTLGWVQHAQAPFGSALRSQQPAVFPRDRSVHVQSTFERDARKGVPWRIFGSYTQQARTRERPSPDSFTVDRLVDGPIPVLVADLGSTERRWSLGARVSPSSSERRGHRLQIGADIEGIGSHAPAPFAGVIGELVDGVPARVWAYTNPGLESRRHATTVAAFASERLRLSPRLRVDVALRFESVDGGAAGAATGIGWRTLLPNARLRWELGTPYDLALVTGYRRSANQLQLGLLAVGDPAAPFGSVFRWDGATGPLVARVGPGSGGDPAFSRIDPGLKRAYTDEFVIGMESRPGPVLRLGVIGIARRQAQLPHVVNTGVAGSSYARFTVPDANIDLIGAADDQNLPVYNRLPESFGNDRYLLTNPEQEAATLGAVVVTAQVSTDRLFLYIGGTASAAVGAGGHRGFRAFENDQDMAGELFTNPNASTYARGRLFNDRAYTIKWTTVYRFPHDIRFGAIARYQDGQPFARLVIVSGLNQGAEAVQAFANGGSRFAFTGTLDVRLQKGFGVGATRLDAILDVYNLLNMGKEVEEYVVTGDRFRTPTAVQPPRAVHVGVRLVF